MDGWRDNSPSNKSMQNGGDLLCYQDNLVMLQFYDHSKQTRDKFGGK